MSRFPSVKQLPSVCSAAFSGRAAVARMSMDSMSGKIRRGKKAVNFIPLTGDMLLNKLDEFKASCKTSYNFFFSSICCQCLCSHADFCESIKVSAKVCIFVWAEIG